MTVVKYLLNSDMCSMCTVGGMALLVGGALALWYFNKGQSEEKGEEPVTSQVEDTNQQEVKYFLIQLG